MTFTFNEDLSTDKDLVRFQLGDTDSEDQLISDEMIAALLTKEGSVNGAAISACRYLIAKFSREVDSSIESISVSASQKVAQFKNLVLDLQRNRGGGLAVATTGITRTQIAEGREDTDRIPPAFDVRMNDIIPGGEGSEYESF